MRKSIILFLFSFLFINILSVSSARAQYYYKDLVSTYKQNKEFSILKNAGFRNVKISSFDEHDQPSDGFFCEKRMNKNFTQSQLMTNSNITGQSLLVTDYNSNGDVIKTKTTTPNTNNNIEFTYDSNRNIILIRTETIADGDSSGIVETHQYFYIHNLPVKMIRMKNNVVVATITFLSDEKGNIIEEDPSGNGDDKKYFYYYDDKNRLTDVVHYNVIAKRLLPDYMFEYSEDREPKQMISVDETGRNYFIWRYAYDDKKLPEIQKCYSKEKTLLGTIQYDYK
jgi:hypothetical protein